MKTIHQSNPSVFRQAILCLAIALACPAKSEPPIGADSSAILEKARQSDYERTMAAKQTELDRFNEDLKKGKEQAEMLQKLVESVGAAIVEASGRYEHVAAQRIHQPKVMEVLSLKYDAEKQRVEGLKLLEFAQKKAVEAVTKHNEVTDLRVTLGSLEKKLYAEKALAKPDANVAPESTGKKSQLPGGDLRRNLAAAEKAAAAADATAREAMHAATLKLQQADAAAEKAEKRRAELEVEDLSSLPVDKPGTEPAAPEAPKKRVRH